MTSDILINLFVDIGQGLGMAAGEFLSSAFFGSAAAWQPSQLRRNFLDTRRILKKLCSLGAMIAWDGEIM